MDVVLAGLQIGEVTGLVVDIKNLLAALVVEASETLTGRGTESLLEV